MYKNLKEFAGILEKSEELIRVTTPVSTEFEITEITDRVSKSEGGGKALLFENTGTNFPVLMNMFGSERRMCLSLGVESLDELPARIETLFKSAMSPKKTLRDKIKMLPLIGEVARWLPKSVNGRGECQQVVLKGDDARLSLLPILKCWPHDGGRFVTLPLVHTVDPDTGSRNVGMYRMQVFSDNTTGMHWHLHKTGERHYQVYKRRGERMPVSVALGGDPAYTYSATAPMPDNMDEYLLAGFLRRKSVKLVKCITNDIYVPSDCDFVIEGYVDPAEEKVVEGPFGDHTGFYSLEDMYPVFHVTAITHRRNAIYPATIVGVPPQEDAYIALATEKIFLAPIRMALQPEIKDLYMPQAGVAHNIAIANISLSYPGQALKVAAGLWGAGQMMFNKFMVVASTNASVRDAEVLSGLLCRAKIPEDVMFGRGALDVLDHTTATFGQGGKLAIDVTKERPIKLFNLPEKIIRTEGIQSTSVSLLFEWGAMILYCTDTPDIDDFIAQNGIKGVNYIIIADHVAKSLNSEELLWFAAGNTDPGRDIKVCGDMLIIDARAKIRYDKGRVVVNENYPARWPNVVTSSFETIAMVDKRWSEYGFAEKILSPSLKFIPLLYSEKAQV